MKFLSTLLCTTFICIVAYGAPAIAAAGVKSESLTKLDGVELIPWLSDDEAEPPRRDLFWRFWGQAAIRSGQWKYLVTSDGREMLFNIRDDKKERYNLFSTHPETGSKLKSKLQ